MTGPGNVLGIDFGTSNSAAGILRDGKPFLVEVEPGETTLPTALFFDFDRREVAYGSRAAKALTDGEFGRYMRALKSLLGTPLIRESRSIMGQRMDYIAIIGRFLAELKSRAETACGQRFSHALSGRPVHFHSGDATRDAQAETDLRDCYAAAGFEDVRFLHEPEAAAIANHSHLAPGALALIVDIGGGTSDFTLFRAGAKGMQILASHGIRLGGTDFDRLLSLQTVMPLLGHGTQINNTFGKGALPAPNTIFLDLATWQKIHLLYTPDTLRAAQDLHRHAAEPAKLARLVRTFEDHLGHDLAFAVERGKIGANTRGAAEIDLTPLERGLTAPLTARDLDATLAEPAAQIAAAAVETLEMAGHSPAEVDSLVYVGGTSLMALVDRAMRAAFPGATPHRASALTAVAEGLAIASASAFRD